MRLFLVITFLIIGCVAVPIKREITKVDEIASINSAHKYVKAHMKNGQVYILHDWFFNEANNTLNGYGTLLDINRRIVEIRSSEGAKEGEKKGSFQLDISRISLLETNEPGPTLAGGLAVVTGITGFAGLICLLNPKACFGSCPTFYASNGHELILLAEGFSSSIAPALEKRDIDMLYGAKTSKNFEVTIKNEALETHCIRYANLLVFEKNQNRIFSTPGGIFFRSAGDWQPEDCKSQNGDCLTEVTEVDGIEYYSLSDSNDLSSREELFISFDVESNKRLGLVIGKRQTLLTTYLMYQGLAYMGKSVSYWLSTLDRNEYRKKENIFDVLGGIEVYSKDSNSDWKFEGEVNETGPIASDFNVIPLHIDHHGKVELKLRLNKGLWRIDYLRLAELSEEVIPELIEPCAVDILDGSEKDPLEKLINPDEYLVTYPGNSYRIKYNLPYDTSEVFLDTKGYYLEWIRDEWVKEQDFQKLNLMLNNPARYLKKVAGPYKELESTMEQTFWNSRYANK